MAEKLDMHKWDLYNSTELYFVEDGESPVDVMLETLKKESGIE